MFDFNTVSQNQVESHPLNHANGDYTATVLPFTYSFTNSAKAPESEGDMIDRRMMFPLHDDERKAVLHMLQQRAKFLGEALWIATENFLMDMGMEKLDDLRRCDFVRAVEYLVAFTESAQARKAMQ